MTPQTKTGSLFAIFWLLLASMAVAGTRVDQRPSETDLQTLIPDGYRVDKVCCCSIGGADGLKYIVAISDKNTEIPGKAVRILLIKGPNKWSVIDDLEVLGDNPQYQPNYVEKISFETVGNNKLIFLYTILSGGGSGSIHYYQFYTIIAGKLQLLKTIEHGRMMRLYFCLYDHKIYNAKLVKIRGKKKGKAFVYACYLEATEYTYDGKSIIPVRAERFRKKKGNRFLDEKYWCVSLRNAIIRKEVFNGQLK